MIKHMKTYPGLCICTYDMVLKSAFQKSILHLFKMRFHFVFVYKCDKIFVQSFCSFPSTSYIYTELTLASFLMHVNKCVFSGLTFCTHATYAD